jgi:cellulose synthase/poly-beta-1,6-N-acetylglucosamine synthase-like glycosyltransferase
MTGASVRHSGVFALPPARAEHGDRVVQGGREPSAAAFGAKSGRTGNTAGGECLRVPAAPMVSVIICAYTENRWELLLRSVDSVREQTLRPCEIIVCIDQNDALLVRVIRRLGAVREARREDYRVRSGQRAGRGDAAGNLQAVQAAHRQLG